MGFTPEDQVKRFLRDVPGTVEPDYS